MVNEAVILDMYETHASYTPMIILVEIVDFTPNLSPEKGQFNTKDYKHVNFLAHCISWD